MKHFLIVILLFAVNIASAQNVNIPDPFFKAELINYAAGPAIDANHDGEIQLFEALAVSTLYLGDPSITDLTGISSFSNLDSLYISNPLNFTKLDLQGMTSLYCVRAYINSLDSLSVAGCSNLHILDLGTTGNVAVAGGNDSMRYFNISGADKLLSLDCGILNIPLLDLRALDSLQTLIVQVM